MARDMNNEWDNSNSAFEPAGEGVFAKHSTPRNVLPDEFTELPQFTSCDCS